MLNLLVHWNEEAWDGEPNNTFELARCVREYTDPEITARYAALDQASIAALIQMPAIFAYERSVGKAPRLGRLTRIERRVNAQEVYFEYELLQVAFITSEQLWGLEGALDLGRWEQNRAHWAVKAIDLGSVLHRFFALALPPQFANAVAPVAAPRVPVNIRTHPFEVAVSFPGAYRETVERVVRRATALLGPDSCFYDYDYQEQLAAPQIDLLLQEIYRNRARLIVVFLGSAYQERPWPGIEWNAIRAIINLRQHERIMFVRMDDGAVEGVQSHDGYIDGQRFDAETIGSFVAQRVWLLGAPPPPGPPPPLRV